MSEIGVRILVVVLILVVVGIAALVSGRSPRATRSMAVRDDLPPGVHLFTSSTCAACREARKVIASRYGNAFAEIRHEDNPESFLHHNISRAPTTIVVRTDGTAVVLEGVPRRRHLPALQVMAADQ